MGRGDPVVTKTITNEQGFHLFSLQTCRLKDTTYIRQSLCGYHITTSCPPGKRDEHSGETADAYLARSIPRSAQLNPSFGIYHMDQTAPLSGVFTFSDDAHCESFIVAGQPKGPRRRVCGLYALHSPREAQVDRTDIKRLRSGNWLNDRLVNYGLWLVAASFFERGFRPSDFTFIPSDVWQNWDKKEHLPDVQKFAHSNPILSNFIAMPCNVNDRHWILLVVAYPSDLVADSPNSEQRTAALYFDSYPEACDSRQRGAIHEKVRRFLARLAGRPSASTEDRIANLPAVYPKVRLWPCYGASSH